MQISVRKIVDVPRLEEKIKQSQAKSGKTVKDVCREANIHRTYWYKIVGGDSVVSLDLLKKLEKILNCDFEIE